MGTVASILVYQFRLLIDDVAGSRFTDLNITNFLNVAEVDVINELREVGWDFARENSEDATILADTQEVALTVSNTAYSPIMVRRNETNDETLIPLVPHKTALKSTHPVCYFIFRSTQFLLGYYRKVSSAMKFTVFFVNEVIPDFSNETYNASEATSNLPGSYSNLILYGALALASTTDTNRAGIFDARYTRALINARNIVGPGLEQVVDVY